MVRALMVLAGLILSQNWGWAGALQAPSERPGQSASASSGAAALDQEEKPDFVITDDTEVLLDGQRCLYSEVPDNAEIIYIEVAKDRQTALVVHFRTRK